MFNYFKSHFSRSLSTLKKRVSAFQKNNSLLSRFKIILLLSLSFLFTFTAHQIESNIQKKYYYQKNKITVSFVQALLLKFDMQELNAEDKWYKKISNPIPISIDPDQKYFTSSNLPLVAFYGFDPLSNEIKAFIFAQKGFDDDLKTVTPHWVSMGHHNEGFMKMVLKLDQLTNTTKSLKKAPNTFISHDLREIIY